MADEPELRPGGLRTWAIEVAATVDPLLADLWPLVWASGERGELTTARLAGLLRMAYLQGYGDALCEDERGSVFRRIGVEVPEATPAVSPRRSRSRRSKGSSGS